MKKANLTEEQIIEILHEHETSARCADLCHKHGMPEGTFYALKVKCSGMTLSEGRHWCTIDEVDGRDPRRADLRSPRGAGADGAD